MDFNTNYRIAYLEVQQIVDAEKLICIDFLEDPKALLEVHAPSIANFICRFDRIIVYLYPLDNYWKAAGRIIQFEPVPTIEPIDLLQPICEHLGYSENELALKDWIEENFEALAEAIEQLRLERQSLKIQNADTRFSKTDYELKLPTEEIIDAIESIPNTHTIPLTDEDWQEGFQHVSQWRTDDSPEKSFPMGLVMIGSNVCRLESLGEDNHERFKNDFHDKLGEHMDFKTELGTDLGAQIASREPERDKQLIPPALLEQIEIVISDLVQSESVSQREAASDFPSTPHSLLGNKTPLVASQDEQIRPILIDLVKQRVRETDLDNLRKDRDYDINELLQNLNLYEIDFPPPGRVKQSSFPEYGPDIEETPTPTAIPEMSEQQQEDLAYYDEAFDRDLDLARLRAWEESLFETRAKALILHRIMGPSQGACYQLIDNFYQITPDLIKEEEFQICVPSLITVWLALIPTGAQPVPPKEDLEFELEQMIQLFEQNTELEDESTFDIIIPHSQQKELLYAVLDHFERMLNEMPEDELPENASEGAMYAVIAAAINILDRYV